MLEILLFPLSKPSSSPLPDLMIIKPFPDLNSSHKPGRQLTWEKCEYFSAWIELAQPNISWAPKHVKRRKAPGAEKGVKERRNVFAFFFWQQLINSFRDHIRDGNWIWFVPSAQSHPISHISYGQGFTPRVLRRMFYGLSPEAESWKIHRHYSLLCIGIHVYEKISYTALSKREAYVSKENREIQSNTKCYSAAPYCKWPFYALERKKSLLKAQLLH